MKVVKTIQFLENKIKYIQEFQMWNNFQNKVKERKVGIILLNSSSKLENHIT